jgi:lipopolysaccharide export system permease protein
MLKFNKILIFKNFFNDVFKNFLLLLFSLSLIVWVIQAVNYLDFITEDGHGINIYLKYSLLNYPKIFTKLIPVIFFISLFSTLIKYEETNELNIFWLNGVTKVEFSKNIMKFSLIVILILLTFKIILIPFAQKQSRVFIQNSTIEYFPSLISEKNFIDTVKKLNIYIEKKNKNNLENIFLKDDRNSGTRIIYAKKGYLNTSENKKYIELEDGKIISLNNQKLTEFEFKKTIFNLSNNTTKSIIDFKFQERDTLQLLNCYISYYTFFNINKISNSFICDSSSVKQIRGELYNRIFKPFYIIALSILTSCMILLSKENSYYTRLKKIIFILGFFILIISELFDSFSRHNNYIFMFSLFLPFAIFFITTYFFKQFCLSNKLS